MRNHRGQLDTAIEIVTPENIAFQYRLAGPFRRMLAYVIDLVIQVIAVAVGTLAMIQIFGVFSSAPLGFGGGLVLWFIISWFYGGVFEAVWNGQTPGKRLLGLRVLTIDGQPINGLQAVLRNVLRALDMQPVVFCQVGLIAAAANDRFQRLGDLAAGTIVVVEQRPWFQGLERLGEQETASLVSRIPASFQPSRSLGQTLAAYVQRRRMFSLQRREEIARHVAGPLVEQLGLPASTNSDLLLCALYQRTFGTDQPGDGRSRSHRPSADVGRGTMLAR